MSRLTEQTQDLRSNWQDAFKSNTTRVRFVLSLTRPMLEFLCAASAGVYWDRRAFGGLTYPDNWIATEHGLTKRGLITRLPPQPTKNGQQPPPWSLTPAGEKVIELLKVGGLFIDAREAVDRMTKRKGRL